MHMKSISNSVSPELTEFEAYDIHKACRLGELSQIQSIIETFP